MHTYVELCTTLWYDFLLFSIRLGIQPTSIRFSLDGERVTADQTPKMLEMEDGDQIDARIEQQGGGEESGEPTEATITLAVKDGSGNEMNFKVKKTTKFEKIFTAYATRY